jgi:hypothetical protein
MSLLKRFDETGSGPENERFASDLQRQQQHLAGPQEDLGIMSPREEFRCAFVMPKADQNLDTIYRQERPHGNSVRRYMLQVGECLEVSATTHRPRDSIIFRPPPSPPLTLPPPLNPPPSRSSTCTPRASCTGT